ncbi:MAG: DUF29 domain-containing protein [Phormidesmis sp.]
MTTSPFLKQNAQSLYETDYAQWIEVTLQKLQQQDYAAVDWENLIEEIEDMGRSEKRSLKSNLTVILLHLLKWRYQTERRSQSWAASIVEHRIRVRDALEESPSLNSYLDQIFAKAYKDAVKLATAETGLPKEMFPAACPYTRQQVLDEDFMP